MSDGGSQYSALCIDGRPLGDYLQQSDGSPNAICGILLLTPRETAKHLRTSERTLERRRLIGDGPPFVKIGALIRYPFYELEGWLKGRLRCSTSEGGAPTGRRPRRKAVREAASQGAE